MKRMPMRNGDEYDALTSARKAARNTSNKGSLRSLGLACQMYAHANNDSFPNSITDLTTGYIDSTGTVSLNGNPFTLETGVMADSPTDTVICIDSSIPGFTNYLYVDAHIVTKQQ